MPAVLTYPGVYVEELESGVRTISGVATSIAAFVGRTKLGPTNEPVTINSFGDFESNFGGLWLDSPLSFAVQDFFLNGGGQAVILRLFSDSAEKAAAKTANTEASAGAKAVATEARAAVADAAVADGAGVAKKAKDKLDALTGAANSPEKVAGTAVFNAANAAATGGGDKEAVAKAAEGAVNQAVADAVDKAVRDASAAKPTRAQITIGTGTNALKLEAASPGTWGNKLRVRVDNADVLDATKQFNLTIFEGETETIESFRNVSIDATDLPRFVGNVLNRRSALIRLREPITNLPPVHKDAPPGAKIWEDDDLSQKVDTSGNGNDGDVLTRSDFAPDGGEAKKKGLYALDYVDLFNLLCIPPHRLQEDPNTDQGTIELPLIADAIRYCERRRAMFLIDPPASWASKAAAVKGIASEAGEVSKNAAIYFPTILRPNPKRDNKVEPFAPCGAAAGVIARTDTERGVWKAPAGLAATLFNAPALTVPLTDAENGELNVRGVNCLRAMPAAGRVVWGARTRLGDDRNPSEWKYVPVRRTALFIEESLYRGTHWVVFEPNDEPLWASIRLNVGSFMNQLFRQGAFQGATPREAYFVRCDSSTTKQADIDRGIVNIHVGFAPLKPAEFVVLKIQQMAGQIQV